MKCFVFIAASVDGFIADEDGGVDWLDTAGNPNADMGEQADMGFNTFIEAVDCMIMGRGTMETLSGFDLAPEEWPYRGVRVIVLSNSLTQPPGNLKDRVEMYSGDPGELIEKLESEGHSHAYIDGGKTIQSFLDLQLIHEMTLTIAPVILGAGIPLFGRSRQSYKLENTGVEVFPNDFVQLRYAVRCR